MDELFRDERHDIVSAIQQWYLIHLETVLFPYPVVHTARSQLDNMPLCQGDKDCQDLAAHQYL